MSGRVTARSAVADLSTDARDANESSLELNKNIGPMDGDSANDYLSETSSRFIQRRSVRLDSDTTTIDLEETALRENCKVCQNMPSCVRSIFVFLRLCFRARSPTANSILCCPFRADRANNDDFFPSASSNA
jgi:hypothetical protein